MKRNVAGMLAAVLVTTSTVVPTAQAFESNSHIQGFRTSEEVNQDDQNLVIDGYAAAESESDFSYQVAPVIIWGGVAALGILTGGGLVFYSMYTTKAEKDNLVNKCYEKGGNPVIDSRDTTGLEGSPDSAAANRDGGYRFECQE